MKKDKVYLHHILDAIADINHYLDGMDYSDFEKNKMAIDAVIRKLEIIGEATNNLSSNFIAMFSDFPVNDPVDMRNFLIHEYFGVKTKIVWDTCKNDLPGLKNVINKILDD